jgi:tRNA pseudouridine65 synthase
MTTFDILFEDDWLVAINKPSGILVHRTGISEDTVFVLQLLRNQLGLRVNPIHRLDRGTSGVLLFGKTQEGAREMGAVFREKTVKKEYVGIVRGFIDEEGLIDHPIVNYPGAEGLEAVTAYRRLAMTELPAAVGRYATARYSLVSISPETGRWRQIRKHFSHLRHPIIGDKKHGDLHHNKYFSESLGISRLLLHARELSFTHPFSNQPIVIVSPWDEVFAKAVALFEG